MNFLLTASIILKFFDEEGSGPKSFPTTVKDAYLKKNARSIEEIMIVPRK